MAIYNSLAVKCGLQPRSFSYDTHNEPSKYKVFVLTIYICIHTHSHLHHVIHLQNNHLISVHMFMFSIAYIGPSVIPSKAFPGFRIYTIDGDYEESSNVR